MTTLELTLMARGAESNDRLQAILRGFEAQTHVQVQLTLLDWEAAWNALVRVALYNTGPDLSEVGSTWLSDFVGMNAVRPFQPGEAQQTGGAAAFFAPTWNSGVAPALRQTGLWSAPFLVDTRLLVYRRDWLAEAGVDETTAFATPANFLQALTQLAAARCPGPGQSHLMRRPKW